MCGELTAFLPALRGSIWMLLAVVNVLPIRSRFLALPQLLSSYLKPIALPAQALLKTESHENPTVQIEMDLRNLSAFVFRPQFKNIKVQVKPVNP